MSIAPIPCLEDNYAWLLWRGQEAVIVDPGEAAPVMSVLAARGLKLVAILATHHHGDHVGGIQELVRAFPDVCVIASAHDAARVPAVNLALRDGLRFELIGLELECLEVPGHTLGAVAYLVPAWDAVFTGDTLFGAGCGRLFEGTAPMMYASLQRLAQLPPQTRVYCGHEYTQKNVRFALELEPDNAALLRRREKVARQRGRGQPSVPATLAVELETNPFLRSEAPALVALAGTDHPVEVFAWVRRRRDAW